MVGIQDFVEDFSESLISYSDQTLTQSEILEHAELYLNALGSFARPCGMNPKKMIEEMIDYGSIGYKNSMYVINNFKDVLPNDMRLRVPGKFSSWLWLD